MSERNKLKHKFRDAVRAQTVSTKLSQLPRCQLCKGMFTHRELEVDHAGKFSKLMDAFLVRNPAPEPSPKRRDHPEWFKKWEEFHARWATVSILCIPCHRHKDNGKWKAQHVNEKDGK